MEVEGGRGVACMMRRRLRSDTFVMRGGGRGLGPPIQNRARRLGFGLHRGINGWDGDLWHQISLYHGNLRDGELIVSWLRWNEGFCSPGYLHPSSLLSHTLIHSHLAPLLLSHPRSARTCQVMARRPRIWCRWSGRRDERKHVALSRLAEFQTPTAFNRESDFRHSTFCSSLKIVKICICTLYVHNNVPKILFC
jgi:hypothetical protein